MKCTWLRRKDIFFVPSVNTKHLMLLAVQDVELQQRIAMSRFARLDFGVWRDVMIRVTGFSSRNVSEIFRATHGSRIYATFVQVETVRM